MAMNFIRECKFYLNLFINLFMFRKNEFYNLKKNHYINRNINDFIKGGRKTYIPREVNFCPEVIIPCYNQGRFLEAAISSVPINIPITIINDASTDDTTDWIKKLEASYKFKVINNIENLNQSGSINKAIVESNNNLFIILNADDLLMEHTVDKIMEIFRRYDVHMVGGSSIHFSNNNIIPYDGEIDKLPNIYKQANAIKYKDMNDINMTMSSCSFLKSAWSAVDGFWAFEDRVCSCDDRDFQMRVSAFFSVAVLPIPLAYYRTDSSVGRGQSC